MRNIPRAPASKVLVHGPRRMGKTSAVHMAIKKTERRGGRAFLADLSTASTVADMANRILAAATRELGKRWKDLPTEFVRRLGVNLRLEPDPGTGLILPSLDLGLRRSPVEDQRRTFAQVLDPLNDLAGSRERGLGVVLDEFQEIHRFGGEEGRVASAWGDPEPRSSGLCPGWIPGASRSTDAGKGTRVLSSSRSSVRPDRACYPGWLDR